MLKQPTAEVCSNFNSNEGVELIKEFSSSQSNWRAWLRRGITAASIIVATGAVLYYGGPALVAGVSTLAAGIGSRLRENGQSIALKSFEESPDVEIDGPYATEFRPDPALSEYQIAMERQKELMKSVTADQKTEGWQKKALKKLNIENFEDERGKLQEEELPLYDFQERQPASVFSSVIELSSLDGRIGFKIEGEDLSFSGKSVSAAGDINGDGISDLIIGAPNASPGGKYRAGRSYVIFGHRDTWASPMRISNLNSTTGFVLNGEAADDQSGWSVSTAGDFNGDGIDDIIIGAPYANNQAGRSYVIFGHRGVWTSPIELSSLDNPLGIKIEGEVEKAHSGGSVSTAGDVNDDNITDIIISAYCSGRRYVIFGHQGTWISPLQLSNLNGTLGLKIDGQVPSCIVENDRVVNTAGDVNGDGIDDIIIGEPYSDSHVGRSYVIFGHGGSWTSPVQLSDLAGEAGFRMDGESEAVGESGCSVSNAGDVNGDGIDDLVVGAYYASFQDILQAGRSYVIFGHRDPWVSPVQLSQLNGTTGFKINGEAIRDFSGVSVSTAGDIDGDGIADLIIGAYMADLPYITMPDIGRSYVIFGHQGAWVNPLQLSGLDGTVGFKIYGEGGDETSVYGDLSGWSVSAAGDVNHDGVDDVIIGAPWADVLPLSGKAGKSYVIFGRSSVIVTSEASLINNPPVLVENTLIIHQGGKVRLTSKNLCATDIDHEDMELMYTVANIHHGHFERITNPGIPIINFTQQDIVDEYIYFIHDGSDQAPSYTVRVSDGQLTTTAVMAQVTFIKDMESSVHYSEHYSDSHRIIPNKTIELVSIITIGLGHSVFGYFNKRYNDKKREYTQHSNFFSIREQ